MSQLRAGVARATTSPEQGIYLVGYYDREMGSTGVHDDLTATALALDDGTQQAVLIALDLLGLHELLVDRVREGIAERVGIAPRAVMIACSHTHSGPAGYADPSKHTPQRRYLDGLVETLVGLVEAAAERLAPVEVLHGVGETSIAHNRRQQLPDGTVIIGDNPDGPVDRSLHVVEFRAADGAPLATLVNLACHGVAVGPANLLVSADWPGVMRRTVEAETGAPCLFVQGAAGDLNPVEGWNEDDPWGPAERLGREAGQAALAVRAAMQPIAGAPLRALNGQAWLHLVKQPMADAKTAFEQTLSSWTGAPVGDIDRVLRQRFPWEPTLEQQKGQWYTPLEVQALRIGEVLIAAHAAETFTAIGAQIKDESPAERTLFAGYANGLIGYLPTAAEHRKGGYEVDVAPYVFRMPGLLDPNAAQQAVEHSLKLLGRVWDDEE